MCNLGEEEQKMELMETNPGPPESDVSVSDDDSEPPLASICTPDTNAASTATRLSSGDLWRRTGAGEVAVPGNSRSDTILVRPAAAELMRKRWKSAAREVINQRRAGGGAT